MLKFSLQRLKKASIFLLAVLWFSGLTPIALFNNFASAATSVINALAPGSVLNCASPISSNYGNVITAGSSTDISRIDFVVKAASTPVALSLQVKISTGAGAYSGGTVLQTFSQSSVSASTLDGGGYYIVSFTGTAAAVTSGTDYFIEVSYTSTNRSYSLCLSNSSPTYSDNWKIKRNLANTNYVLFASFGSFDWSAYHKFEVWAAVLAPPTLTGAAISGTTTQGQTLTASIQGAGGGTATTTTYQWSRADSSGGSYSNISGATASTYVLASADVAKYIKVTISVSNSDGSNSATSSASAQISEPTPEPTPSPTATPAPPPPSYLKMVTPPKISQNTDFIICTSASFIFMRYSISPEQAKIDTQIISIRSEDLLLAQSESIDLTVKFSKSLFKAGLTLTCYQHAQQESSVAEVSSLNSDETISIKRAEKAGQVQVQSAYKSASANLAVLRKIELSNLLVKRSIESKTCWFSVQLLQEARERHVVALGLVEEKYVRQQQVLLAQKYEALRDVLIQSDIAKEAAGILLLGR